MAGATGKKLNRWLVMTMICAGLVVGGGISWKVRFLPQVWGNSGQAFATDLGFASVPAYIKASNTGANDLFGGALALSADGKTLAVGAYEETSAAKGIYSSDNPNDNRSSLKNNSGPLVMI